MGDDRPSFAVDQDELRVIAEAYLSSTPRPFLKWAGSKRMLLRHLIPHLPRRFGRYFEPFLGGGSLFFLLRPKQARLGDACAELINTYQAVRDNPASVLRYLSPLDKDKATFYRVRKNRSAGRFKRAAEFIYLNKTCWNGLYRVNSKGGFNVPYGIPSAGPLADSPNLRACSDALDSPEVELSVGDFEASAKRAAPGDLVFFDPPYVTGHRNNGFVDYNEVLFSWDDQLRLAELAQWLAKRGCFVMITNADHEMISGLYDNFQHVRVSRRSTISSKADGRGYATELILLGGQT